MQRPTVLSECPTRCFVLEILRGLIHANLNHFESKKSMHSKEVKILPKKGDEEIPKVLQLKRDNHIETDIWSRRRPMDMSEEDSVCTSNRKSKDLINTNGTRRNFRGTIK